MTRFAPLNPKSDHSPRPRCRWVKEVTARDVAASPSPPAEGGEGRGEEGRANPADSPHPNPLPVRRGEGEGASHSLSFLNSTAVHPSLWGEGELSSRRFRGASSSEHDPLQARFQFLAALDMLVRLGVD